MAQTPKDSSTYHSGVTFADHYSYASAPRPFKNPYFRPSWASTGTGGKRNKPLKQVLVIERERVDKIQRERREIVDRLRTEGQPVPSELLADVVSSTSVEAPPSILPPKKYCDITGLEAKYVDPKSTLRYHNTEVYEVLKTFQPAVIQSYLEIRGQGVVLR